MTPFIQRILAAVALILAHTTATRAEQTSTFPQIISCSLERPIINNEEGIIHAQSQNNSSDGSSANVQNNTESNGKSMHAS
jgi:hypothetical protein